MTSQTFVCTPIGFVQANDQGYALHMESPYRAALQGLDEFGAVTVLWWSHLLDQPQHRQVLEAHHPYTRGPEVLGIFATRSQLRPNPICVSVVNVLGVDPQAGVITIPWTDAEDGTPILDIKPYQPCVDRLKEVKLPAWCQHWPQWVEDNAAFDWAAEFDNA